MPCQDYMPDTALDLAQEEEIRRLKRRCNMLARTACAALTSLEALIESPKLIRNVDDGDDHTERARDKLLTEVGGLTERHRAQALRWWARHQRLDAERKAREVAEAEAAAEAARELTAHKVRAADVLMKLSEEDRAALVAVGALKAGVVL